MQQVAKVIESDGKYAVIEASRSSMCEGCASTDCGGSCGMAGLFSTGKKMTTRANNPLGAKPGDLVEVGSPTGTVLLHALIVFILPVALAIAAYLIGSAIFSSQNAALICSGGAFAAAIAAVLLFESAARKKDPDVTVLKIIRRAEEADEDPDERSDTTDDENDG